MTDELQDLNVQIEDTGLHLDTITEILSQPGAFAGSTALATWVTAAATIVLAVFAIAAWLAAKKQVDDQIWGRQVEALSRYLSLLYEFRDTPPGLDEAGHDPDSNRLRGAQLLDLTREVATAGSVWRLLHRDNAREAQVLQRAEYAIILSFEELESTSSEHTCWWNNVSECLDFFQEWQRAKDKSPVTLKVEQHILTKFDPLVKAVAAREGFQSSWRRR